MRIQSLSVVVPAKRCINNCRFCVAHMHGAPYIDNLNNNQAFYGLYQNDFLKRLDFARDNGCNTVMLTGDAEPQQNRAFLEKFGTLNAQLERPFRWVEMQTTGALLDDGYLRFLRNHVGVSTISVSICSFSSKKNADICRMRNPVDLVHLCREIKRYDFNLRLSINLTDEFDQFSTEELFRACDKDFGADQVTFRVLYSADTNTHQGQWVADHGAKPETVARIKAYIQEHGTKLERLEYGTTKWSVHGMSTVLDDDCMSKAEGKDELKYLILRPNCKLYSKWDDPASLIF